MELTKEQCEEFFTKPDVNPLTGRKIEVGKPTYQKILKACDLPIPPMGPFIHPFYNAKNPIDDQKNMLMFLKFIQPEVKILEDQDIVSLFYVNDLISILKEANKVFYFKPSYIGSINKLIDRLKEVKKRAIHDLPTYDIVVDKEIKPSRYFVRGVVLRCYELFSNNMHLIDYGINENKFNITVGLGLIKDILRHKKYLDHIIKLRIFSHDDIYKHTFPNDKVYDELKSKYKVYEKLYKKANGHSPI